MLKQLRHVLFFIFEAVKSVFQSMLVVFDRFDHIYKRLLNPPLDLFLDFWHGRYVIWNRFGGNQVLVRPWGDLTSYQKSRFDCILNGFKWFMNHVWGVWFFLVFLMIQMKHLWWFKMIINDVWLIFNVVWFLNRLRCFK